MGVQNPTLNIFGQVNNTANQTLTSATLTLLTSIVSPSTLPAGTYKVGFTGEFQSVSSGATITAQLFVNGVADADTSRTIAPFDAGALSAFSAQGVIAFEQFITITAGQTFEVRDSRSAGNAVAGERTMTWLKVL